MTPDTCPNCGADVPHGAKSCPECGSDEKTGWSDDAESASLDLPDDSFKYDEFVSREFGAKKNLPPGVNWVVWITAIILLLLFTGGLVLLTRS